MVQLESVQEFGKHFLLSLLSGLNVWVVLSVVDSLDVADVNDARAILIELVEGFLDKIFANRVHLTNHAAHKFIIVDFSVPVQVKQIKKLAALFRGDWDSEVAVRLPEFLDVESS